MRDKVGKITATAGIQDSSDRRDVSSAALIFQQGSTCHEEQEWPNVDAVPPQFSESSKKLRGPVENRENSQPLNRAPGKESPERNCVWWGRVAWIELGVVAVKKV